MSSPSEVLENKVVLKYISIATQGGGRDFLNAVEQALADSSCFLFGELLSIGQVLRMLCL